MLLQPPDGFQPAIEEAINQLDSLILDGDYYLDEAQRNRLAQLLDRWSRVHTEHVLSAIQDEVDALQSARRL